MRTPARYARTGSASLAFRGDCSGCRGLRSANECRNRRARLRGAPAGRVLLRGGPRRGRRGRRPAQDRGLGRGESYIEDVPDATLEPRSPSAWSPTGRFAELTRCDAVIIAVPDAADPQPRAGPRARSSRAAAAHRARPAARPARGARVDHLPRHHPRAARARCSRSRASPLGSDFNVAFSPERVDPGRTDYTHAEHAEGRRRPDGACLERARGALRRGLRRGRLRLHTRGRRAHEAPREHVPVREHRARERARDAVRPHGHRHLGGGRRRVHEALRLHALRARSRHGRPLPAGRPVLPRVASARVRLARRTSSSWPARSTRRCRASARRRSPRALNEDSKPVRGSRIAILGVSYKAGVGDMRESPALKIMSILQESGALLRYHDEFVPELSEFDLRSEALDERSGRLRRGGDRHGPSWPRPRSDRRAGATGRRLPRRDRREARPGGRAPLSAGPALGTYGLGLRGVEAASALLGPAGEDWPTYSCRLGSAPPRTGFSGSAPTMLA